MGAPIIRRFADAEAVSRAAAEECVRLAREAVATRGRLTVALSGGSTPRRLYQLLAAPPFRDRVEWNNVEFFWGDERAVPPNHPDSNFRMASEAMLNTLQISPTRIHRMQAERPDRVAAAAEYQREIARVFGVAPDGEPPAFDLVLLGMGPDGHTASLFPFTPALKERRRWVVENHVPELNADRLTLTPVILNRARCIIFLAAGADKAVPLAEVLEGPADTERLPAQLISPVDGTLLWLTDTAAAARLRSGPERGTR